MLPGVSQVTIHILADDGLLVGTGNVVPLDACKREMVGSRVRRGGRGLAWLSNCDKVSLLLTVSIVVVEDRHAGLGLSVELGLLPVVWLRDSETSCVGPVVEGAGGVGGRHGHLGGGPEPAIDVLGEEVRSVAAV